MMAQGMGGLISMTGEAERLPVKVPIAINDVMTGMYAAVAILAALRHRDVTGKGQYIDRSEEHTSELQSLMRISYAVFCLKKKNTNTIYDSLIKLTASQNKKIK